ncbi:hypothetical protein RA280_21125 [Cupriavidus sp. CV2]|uniref:hypothetical protein n=1 Tax=Cupriavidus ulmosensis TaxID=3065913 RepID=UPI00296ABCFF|nr:hypothetical protein [Cupriavidus sp. CV2]MDW3684208.1 hypothetical protein [Cupriavidus sp. CV2]
MHISRFANRAAILCACLAAASAGVIAATAPPAPTPEQVTAAIQQSEAERLKQLEQTDPAAAERARSPYVAGIMASIKAHTVKGCLPASGGEIVCIVGVKAGRRDGYRALAFGGNPEPWVLARREEPAISGPDAEQATASMREFARGQLKTQTGAEEVAELTAMATSLAVKQLDECHLNRDSGNVRCAAVVATASKPDQRVSGIAFALEAGGWRFVPREQ